jgi:aspartate 1-decarboxylase
MLREMLQAKIHNAVVTSCQVEYAGSLEVDADLIDRAGMLVNQKIHLLDLTNGARLETYLIPGPRGAGGISVKGAAALLVQPGDRVIIIAYALMDEAESRSHRPMVLVMDDRNQVVSAARS